MTTATILLSLFALMLGALGGAAISRLTDRPREPQTDAEHADLVHEKARDLNLAMHNARTVGLTPAIKISPIDSDLPPGSRPLRVTVHRGDGQAVPRSEFAAIDFTSSKIAANEITAGDVALRVGEHVYSRFFDDSYLEVVRYVDDNNWWFKIIGQEHKGIAKAKTPFSKMARTREEAYNRVR